MTKILRHIVAALVLLPCLASAVRAQDAAGPVGRPRQTGIDEERDALAMQAMRTRMDSIRRHRPTVALVLAGGGARGTAHVGVIRRLRELGIPIDMVTGTSMGGLVGALFALGYDDHALDSLVRNIDWNHSLTDKITRRYLSYTESQYRETYVLSFPFYYSRRRASGSRAPAGEHSAPQGLGLGAEREKDASAVVRDNLMGSLPSGFIFGQNVSQIFSSLTVGYQDTVDFLRLPIPFVCVATDLVSAKAKNWHEGKLNSALRATMSIPGMFSPVKMDGMVLVDGGMRNNYPTDIAVQMGADFIIGVDLSVPYLDYKQINNLGDVFSQGIDMLGRPSLERNLRIPDITIRPDLEEFGMMSFGRDQIDTIVARGYRAAREREEDLLALKDLVGPDTLRFSNRPAVNVNNRPVHISEFEITGVNERESRYLMKKMHLRADRPVAKGEIEEAVNTIYGTRAFDYVTYELLGSEEPYRLHLNCKPGPVHQLGIGGRFDSEEIVNVLIHIGLNAHRLQGSAYHFTGRVGLNPYAHLHYVYNAPKLPTVNASLFGKWSDLNQLHMGETRLGVSYRQLRGQLWLSNLNWNLFDVQAGLRYDYFNLSNVMADKHVGDYDWRAVARHYPSAFLKLRSDTFDDGYYPQQGFRITADYFFILPKANMNRRFHSVAFGFKTVVPMGRVVSFLPSLTGRFLFGPDVALPYMNLIGGSMGGRYLDQQIPFIGVNNVAAVQNIVAVARGDLRFRITKNNYLTGIFNYAPTANSLPDFFDRKGSHHYFGAGIEYGYDSFVGPFTFNLHWSSMTHRLGAYVSLGFNF